MDRQWRAKARKWGLQVDYYDQTGQLVRASPAAIQSVCRILEQNLSSQELETQRLKPQACQGLRLQLTTGGRGWGLWFPLWALRDESDWGVGDWQALRKVAAWIQSQGGQFLGLLPLYAPTITPEGVDPSPYSPASRLFWNELYLNPIALAQRFNLTGCLKKWQESDFRQRLQGVRATSWVDYGSVWELKKQAFQMILGELGADWKKDPDFEQYFLQNPWIKAFAQWRSQQEPQLYELTLFCQWQSDWELRDFIEKYSVGLYLDFPIGVNPDGFDAGFFQEAFLHGLSVGAPPEPFFEKGQNWGFPPLSPYQLKDRNSLAHRYWEACYSKLCRLSRLLRLDHVMGFHRLYVIPSDSQEGVYLRYPSFILFSRLVEIANEYQVDLIGEDLGTVPEIIRKIMEQTQIKSMHYWQILIDQPPEELLKIINSRFLFGINNHDMPSFVSFLKMEDLNQLVKFNILSATKAQEYALSRSRFLNRWRSCLGDLTWENLTLWVAQNISASYLIFGLGDFLEQREFFNIPSTYKEYPNWRWRFSDPVDGVLEKLENFASLWQVLKSRFN